MGCDADPDGGEKNADSDDRDQPVGDMISSDISHVPVGDSCIGTFAVRHHKFVVIDLRNVTFDGTAKGHITKINDDEFVVTNGKGADTTIAYRDVRDIGRDHVPYW